MATHQRNHDQKPKGWRNIIVDDVAYWWFPKKSAPYIKRVSDRKSVDVWNHCVNKGWYNAMESGDMQWTPKVIAELIRELY